MTDGDTVDEIGLIDIAVVIAENWLLLVVAPVAAGLIAFAIISAVSPRVYDSEALVRIDATQAALLQSPQILDPAIVASSFLRENGGSLSQARQNLNDALFVTLEANTELYRIRSSYKTADEAQEILKNVLDSLIANSAPTESQNARLEVQLQQTRASVSELEGTLARLNRLADGAGNGSGGEGATLGELGQSIVALASNIEQRQIQVFDLQKALEGSVTVQDIVQSPTLADSPRPRGLLMRVALVVLGTGFVVLIAAFVRDAFRRASSDARQLDKVNRIRRAFWLKSKPV